MAEPIPVIVPNETVGDEIVRLIAWLAPNGESVANDQPLVEVETSKALLEICATSVGYVWHCFDSGADVPVGAPICFITESPEAPDVVSNSKQSQDVIEPENDLPPARLTPQAAQLAREMGIDLSTFQRGSLVRSRDILAQVNPHVATAQCAGPAPQTAAASAAPVAGVPLRWESLPKRKIAEGRTLAAGQSASVPSFVTLPHPVAEMRARFAGQKSPISVSAIIIFEVARLLRDYPMFNAIHSADRVGIYEEVNIGWALDDGEGLIVPVIQNADRKTVEEIEEESERHRANYVRNRISANDLTGATFAISDLSGEGVSIFMPLISRGQSAILGVGADLLTLTFDHQLAEGHTAARFLKDLSARLKRHNDASGESAGLGELSCAFCGSSASELRSNKTFLLRCEVPTRAHVCSLCLASY